jgi:hypothetical protein
MTVTAKMRRMLSAALAAATITIIGLISCYEPTSQSASRSGSTPNRTINLRSQQASPESASFRIAREVPQFGGYWFDKEGNLHAYVTDLDAASRLRPELEPVFARIHPSMDRPLDPNRTIVLHKGDYAYPQLVLWKISIARTIGELPDLQFIGVSQKLNQIRIGVRTEAGAEQIRQILARLGVPNAAVKFIVGSRVEMLQGSPTLRDSVIPRVGGLQLELLGLDFDSVCTLGININAGLQFLTASHCTSVRGPDPIGNATNAFQPSIRPTALAEETYDPTYYGAEDIECCPSPSRRCRFSDAAVFTYRAGQRPGNAGQGYIAKTTTRSTGWGINGSIVINGQLDIENWRGLLSGDVVDKMGSQSGWTYGSVTETCTDVPTGTPGNRYWYICQAEIHNANGIPGDSGAPAFIRDPAGKIWWVGLTIARDTYLQVIFVSRMEAIYSEIGYFEILR